MLSTAHTIISVTLATFSPHPALVFVQAFTIHFVADKVLHWNFLIDDQHNYPIIPGLADASLGVLFAWVIIGNQIFSPVYIAAILGGNLPDIIVGLWHITHPHRHKPTQKIIKLFYSFHNRVQTETTKIIPGLFFQVFTVIACLFLIFLS